MLTYLADSIATVLVLFRQQASPVIPTSASYTLYDTAGVALLSDQTITVGPTTTQAAIAVAAQYNGIATDFEKRTLLVKYVYSGRTYYERVVYQLTKWLNHSVSFDQIRNLLGVNVHELKDDDIDLTRAYFEIQTLITAAVLEPALVAGDIREINANIAIACQAALNVLPSLKTRIAQQESDGPRGFSRPMIRDFSDLEASLRSQQAAALDLATGRLVSSPVFVVLTTPIDPVTGA